MEALDLSKYPPPLGGFWELIRFLLITVISLYLSLFPLSLIQPQTGTLPTYHLFQVPYFFSTISISSVTYHNYLIVEGNAYSIIGILLQPHLGTKYFCFGSLLDKE